MEIPLDQAAIDFLDQVPQQHKLQVGPLTEAEWDGALHKRKAMSARGVCGMSFSEFAVLPRGFVALFLLILNTIETGLPWPQLWCWAFTACLPKTDSPTTMLHIRPITIFSVVYRLWSKARATRHIRSCA